MKVDELLATTRDTTTAGRVFTEPYERNGVTVIAAARVSGGAGGGSGHQEGQDGEGGGIGLSARPAGAYVIQDGKVKWLPAVDVNRVITVLGMVCVAFLFSRVRLTKIRARLAERD